MSTIQPCVDGVLNLADATRRPHREHDKYNWTAKFYLPFPDMKNNPFDF